jgi:hypothetical protein
MNVLSSDYLKEKERWPAYPGSVESNICLSIVDVKFGQHQSAIL